jgi:spore coat protein U-like protein
MFRRVRQSRTSAHRAVRALLAAAALGVAAAPGAAEAQACLFTTAGGLNFGTYDPFATAPLDSTSTIFAWCLVQTIRVSLDRGQSGTFAARELRFGAEALRYNLYLDAARTTIWGDGTGGSVELTSGGLVRATVYGRIPPLQDPVVGTYRDTIRVTFHL